MRTPWKSAITKGYIWSLAALIALTLSACNLPNPFTPSHISGSQTNRARQATPVTNPIAAVSLVNAHADWTTNASVPANATNSAFAPSAPQIGYICQGFPNATATTQPTLYKTTDRSASWQALTTPPLPSTTNPNGSSMGRYCSVSINPTDANDIFLQQFSVDQQGVSRAFERTLYRSRDGGVTWSAALATLDHTNGFAAIAVSGSRLIAQANPNPTDAVTGCSDSSPLPAEKPSSLLYASDNGGQSWNQIGQPLEQQNLAVLSMTAMGPTIFAVARTLTPAGCFSLAYHTYSLWRSNDAAHSWSHVLDSPFKYLDQIIFTPKADGSGYYGLLTQAPESDSPRLSLNFLSSSNSGASWSLAPDFPSPLTIPNDTLLTALSPDGVILLETHEGVWDLRPSDAAAQWRLYAPISGGRIWQGVATTLWSFNLDSQAPILRSLPMP